MWRETPSSAEVCSSGSRAPGPNAPSRIRFRRADAAESTVDARDTGAIFTVLSVPVYVHGERWGAAVIGWDPDTITP